MILSRRQLRLLIPLGLAISLSLPGDQTLYAVLPTQAQAVGISLSVVGVLLGINRLIRIPGNPIAGLLYDQFGRRRLFLLGLLLGTLSTASYAIAQSFPAWLAGRLLWGIAWSLLNVGGLTMMLDVTEDHDRGRVIGLYQLSYLVGLAFSPLLGGLLTDAFGFRPALLVGAAVTGVAVIITCFALPETRSTPPATAAYRRPIKKLVTSLKRTLRHLTLPRMLPLFNHPARQSGQGARTLRRAQKGGLLAISYIYLVTFFAGNGVVMSTISLYLKQNFGDEVLIGNVVVGVASLGGLLLAMRSVLGMVAGPISGHLSDLKENRWPVVFGGISVGIAGFGVLILGRNFWSVVLGVVLIALSSGTLLTTLVALTGDLAASDRQGRTIGRLATAGDLGSATGPLLAYALVSLISLRWIYLLCGLSFVSSLLALRHAVAAQES
jgi:MFS family permease